MKNPSKYLTGQKSGCWPLRGSAAVKSALAVKIPAV
jgi:hypothetical protein